MLALKKNKLTGINIPLMTQSSLIETTLAIFVNLTDSVGGLCVGGGGLTSEAILEAEVDVFMPG